LSLAALALASVLKLDVAGDGKPATIRLTQNASSVVVSVTFQGRRHPRERFRFPVDASREDGVCRIPAHLVQESRGFALVDDACDSFHFFWNRKTQHLAWWRE